MESVLSRGKKMGEILTVRQSEDNSWSQTPSVGVCGNLSLDDLITRIQRGIQVESPNPWDYYLWRAEGERFDDDDRPIERCDRWHLKRYEVCSTPEKSKYQAVLLLYYEPVVSKTTNLAA